MTGKKLTLNIIGYVCILFIFWFLFSDLIPKMVISPQDYLYDADFTLFMFGFECVFMGIEIKSCISEYLWYKYSVTQSK